MDISKSNAKQINHTGLSNIAEMGFWLEQVCGKATVPPVRHIDHKRAAVPSTAHTLRHIDTDSRQT